MLLFKKIKDLQNHLSSLTGTIGFVPTMGALHAGHISLIAKSKEENEFTVCSIFVNPLQFNNANDLQKYPRTLPTDMELLVRAGCDILFAPDASEMYPDTSEPALKFDVGVLDTLFEGALRPGHFKGVAIVVHKFFTIVNPSNAYFGLKDYQQCMLIKKLITDLQLTVVLHFEPTLREKDGLAMSSRNTRLSEIARHKAIRIYEALQYAQAHYRTQNITMLEQRCKSWLDEEPLYRTEYFNIVNAETLLPLHSLAEPAVALCAAFVDEVRLIDNLVLN